jgi:hypothetical protein
MSFLGYGNITPNSNINGNNVNVDSSTYAGNFGSNEIPGLPGLAGSKINIDAALGVVPGICVTKGGSNFKQIKRKIKNITKRYMRKNKHQIKTLRNSLRNKYTKSKKNRTVRKRKHSKRQRGGHSQYQNNMPLTPNYSLGGVLSSNNSALANPPPINLNTGNCVDNYNHFTNKGFASHGWW